MKKGLFFSIMLLAGLTLFSQDYQCIRDNATYLYSDGTNIKAYQIDSVVATTEGLDYYNYPAMFYNPNTGCFTTEGPSWIGRKVLVKPNGDNVFTNKNNHSITIKTLVNLDDYWNCYQFETGDYITASIVEIQEMEFLGLSDTVKKITFQAFNSGGNPITHSINQKYLLLSKNFGLIRTINFKLFPDLTDNLAWLYYENCTQFLLTGISNPEVGMQNLTAVQVFDYDVGDEIDTKREYSSYGGYYEYDKFKRHIIQKEYSVNNDSVFYLFSRCGWTEKHIPYEGTIYIYYHDTIWGKYFIGEDSIINVLPDKVVSHDLFYEIGYSIIMCSYDENTGKITKTEVLGFYYDPYYDCTEVMDEWGEYSIYFIEGLGRYYDYYQAWDCSESTYPVYFKKGDEEWGTPYWFNCDDFVTSENEMTTSQKEVLISPNPMGDLAKLTVDNPENKEYQFQLFNSIGVLVKEYQFHTSELMIQRENLGNGIYFYLLSEDGQFICGGKLVIK